MERVHRSQLKGAPYNPRKIDDFAKRKLRDNLKRVGLIQPIVWNKTTGNVVGGHQRLAILDALHDSQNYLLDVAVVELDAKTEKEQNLFLNNEGAQGTWDEKLLKDLLDGGDVAMPNTGFSRDDLELILSDVGGTMWNVPDNPEAQQVIVDAQSMSADLDTVRQQEREAKQKTNAESDASLDTAVIETDNAESGKKSRKASTNEKDRRAWEQRAMTRNDSEFILVVVFDSRSHREQFLRGVKLAPDEKYIDGRKFEAICGLDVTPKSS